MLGEYQTTRDRMFGGLDNVLNTYIYAPNAVVLKLHL